MQITLSSIEIKKLLALAISEGWLSKDCKFVPKVTTEDIEFESEFIDGEGTIVTAIVDIGDFE